ncbi:hypothetical protein Hypma_007981 [Hypsizygus marmoreus]|uniref:Uncharacterized protein n=1 Tax=Hypsizygus marmoreus TaxID=39966 RepID=A0A369K2N8_HYPMA|nr:hypothetical protein Hypma_007981 [Hypsizygus marmoreus]
MNGCPEPLEKIFQKVEEESERRAQEEIANQRTEAALTENAASSATVRVKNRRRGSISITRFGQLADESAKGPSTPKIVSAVASQSAFYQAQVSNESTTSFASGASAHFDDDNAHLEEDNHVTQMHRIVGRQSISQTVGGLLPRRLSRSRSANVLLAGEANVVIGVSVEEATVEAAEGAEMSGTSIHAPGALRNQPSRLTMAGSSPARNSWVAKAKGFTQKFRRKDK